MSQAQLMFNNYLDPDTVNMVDYSSQKSAFPASNMYEFTRRHKVWRTNGYWEITTANRGIVFQDQAGVNITVNIATGEYESVTDFLAAVDTALEGGGAANYTVTQNSTTGKIVITSDLSGGATVFRLMTTSASFTAASIMGFDTATDKTGASTYTADTLKIHTSEWLKWDLGTAINPEAFVICGLRNEAIKLSPTATIKLQGNSTDAWTSPAYDQTLTYDEAMIIISDPDGLHTSGLRYWRLYIVDASNSNLYLELSIAFLGSVLTTTQGAIQFPYKEKFVDPSSKIKTEGGHVIPMKREKTRQITVEWNNLNTSENEDLRDMFEEVGMTKPFFISLDPDEVFSSSLERHVFYVLFDDEPDSSLITPGIFTTDMRFVEVV